MMSKALARRLERLASRKTPNSLRVLKILVTRIGSPDRTIELVQGERNDPRPGLWQGKGRATGDQLKHHSPA
jgi:hypothetical protein